MVQKKLHPQGTKISWYHPNLELNNSLKPLVNGDEPV